MARAASAFRVSTDTGAEADAEADAESDGGAVAKTAEEVGGLEG